jgi:hypothetical protein
MFSFLKKDKKKTMPAQPQGGVPPHLLALRETLYPRASLDEYVSGLNTEALGSFPWSNFVAANESLQRGDQTAAISRLTQIVETEQLPTRVYLQAWHMLRSLGVMPSADLSGRLQGAVLEYYMENQGLDIVAAYSDYSARYWNYSGTGIVWDARAKDIDQLITDMMVVDQAIMQNIRVGQHEAPPVPERGFVRIFLMAYDGACFGYGLYDQLVKDKMGGAAIHAAYNLMTGLMKKKK